MIEYIYQTNDQNLLGIAPLTIRSVKSVLIGDYVDLDDVIVKKCYNAQIVHKLF